jgi:hypothetical protein
VRRSAGNGINNLINASGTTTMATIQMVIEKMAVTNTPRK